MSHTTVTIMFMLFFLLLIIYRARFSLIAMFRLLIVIIKILIFAICSFMKIFCFFMEMKFYTYFSSRKTKNERFIYRIYHNSDHFIGKKLDYIISKVGQPPSSREKNVITWEAGRYSVSIWLKNGICSGISMSESVSPPSTKK